MNILPNACLRPVTDCWLLLCFMLSFFLLGCKENTTANAIETKGWPRQFGFGKPATPQQIAAWDIDVRPDGKGLPAGAGTAIQGRAIYAAKCASCHGNTGVEGPYNHLVSSDTSKAKTIGNYWPYGTTLFDYVRRAMPFNAPGSLTNEEVYHITAYLLHANGLIEATKVINAQSLPKVVMPAQKLFVPDNRTGGAQIR
jgi:S-disulfanyl-L-cysteine oxidoreductase SoxD